ncbi:MAG: Hpt domain-containing protein, partial [Planctomycetes bacterium]|nr:Hpt domain-containing protein [Planctomycetota bacterium]
MAEVPEKVLELLDVLAEEVMLAEPGDVAGFKTLRDGFQELADALPSDAPADMARLVGACRTRLEKMVSGAVPGAQGLEALSRALGVLQPALRDGTPLRLPQEANAPWRLPENVDAEMFGEFLSSQPANLDEAERLLLLLESADDPEAVAALRRLVHTLKGETAILGLTPVEELCHVAEDRLRDGFPRDNGEVFFSLIDWLRQVFSALGANQPLPPSGSLMELLSQPSAPAEPPAPAPAPA